VGTEQNKVIVPSHVKPQSAIKSYITHPKRASKTNLLSDAWRLVDSEFDKSKGTFFFLDRSLLRS